MCYLQGMSLQAIGDLRRLKLDTAESYLAEAMTAGKAYDWHRLHVPDGVFGTVSEHASAQLATASGAHTSGSCLSSGLQEDPEDNPAMPENICADGQGSQNSNEDDYLDVCCAQRAPEDQEEVSERGNSQAHMSKSQGADLTSLAASNRHPESSCVCAGTEPIMSTILADGGAVGSVLGVNRPACADKAPSTPHRSLPCDAVCRTSLAIPQAPIDGKASALRCGDDTRQEQGVDLLSRLQELGVTIKILKEQLPESIRFGQIRLCLAHAGRLSLLQGC